MSTTDDIKDGKPSDIERAIADSYVVKNQPHYTDMVIEPKVFIMANKLGFAEGNVIKYVCRYDKKGTALQDLYKARDYIDWLIEEYNTNRN